MCRAFISMILIIFCSAVISQSTHDKFPFERHGFIIGFGVGMGSLYLPRNDTSSTTLNGSIPNLHLGYMINRKFALELFLPGIPYTSNDKIRGYEGILVTGKYWIKDKWWLLGGTGLTLDAPAFWTVEDPAEEDFHIDFPAIAFATGYEILRKKKFTIDIQYRVFIGHTKYDNNETTRGISNIFSVGFNWY